MCTWRLRSTAARPSGASAPAPTTANCSRCHDHFINYRSLVRAGEIRNQLAKYMRRFKVPITSCKGDVDAIRMCIVAGFFCNAGASAGLLAAC